MQADYRDLHTVEYYIQLIIDAMFTIPVFPNVLISNRTDRGEIIIKKAFFRGELCIKLSRDFRAIPREGIKILLRHNFKWL